MKLTTALTLAFAADAATAHYLFIDTTAPSSIRTPANYLTKAPITDLTSPLLRCNELTPGTPAPTTRDVTPGTPLTFKVDPYITHPGPLQFYLARAPPGVPASAWDGAGRVWFKIATEPARIDSMGGLSWASQYGDAARVTVPVGTPPGEYLLRIEHLALHVAALEGGAQVHVACAQIRVLGEGTGVPGPLVEFPGAYKPDDKGLKVYLFTSQTSYTPPGPPVWSG
ncbi:glycoside hydrolase [Boeremia exigua]|uniref:glycoside hydrolase n=1 Tax=Boeremia exigua TaxID=749465 RepID=UPI001E8E0D16|nr:glycoside hydrolase [Boeremia exigua]KAH6620049.1 glycoside hydrolase [Boeremia exigua]